MSLPDTPYTDIQSVDDFSPEKTMANRFHNEPCQEGFTEQKKFNDDLWDLLMVLHHEVVDNRKLETMRTSAALGPLCRRYFDCKCLVVVKSHTDFTYRTLYI